MLEGGAQTLRELGLTSRQLRVFFELLKYDGVTARALSSASKLARQDVYKVLDELQELGLVERRINIPTRFEAVSFKDALSILLDRKIKETSNLKAKTKKLMGSLKKENEKKSEDGDPKVFLVPEGELVVLRLQRAIENSEKSINLVSSNKSLPQGMFSLVADLKRAVARGVKIRCLTDEPEDYGLQWDVFRGLIATPSFEIRTLPKRLPHHPWGRFCIYDNKELCIALSPEIDFAKSPLLWSNYSGITEVCQTHFDMMWNESRKSILYGS
jgi:sugar-specific transcriptional regulator TrmB